MGDVSEKGFQCMGFKWRVLIAEKYSPIWRGDIFWLAQEKKNQFLSDRTFSTIRNQRTAEIITHG